MLLQDNFWEFRFIDILTMTSGIIGALIAVILTYYLYKTLDKYKEKERIKALFLRMKDVFGAFLYRGTSKKKFMNAELPYLRDQGNDLIKIGVIIGSKNSKKIRGSIDGKLINLRIKDELPLIYLLDQYLIGGEEIQNLIAPEKFDINIDNINSILEEMRTFAKKYYSINLKKKHTKLELTK